MFFAHYVADFTRAWDLLYEYQDPQSSPEHLTLSIDAVGLAFLSRQTSSDTARDMGLRNYGSAIRSFNDALRQTDVVNKSSTFGSVLLLDLFDKIIKPGPGFNDSNYSHVKGALVLAKLRGVENFREGPELRALTNLALNATILALSTSSPIPGIVRDIKKHASRSMDTSFPKWKLNDIILEVTDIKTQNLFFHSTSASPSTRAIELDKKLECIPLDVSPGWTYERKFTSGHDPRITVPDGFFPLYDVYPNRTITQMWNVLRLTRILLCEQIVDGLSASTKNKDSALGIERATLVITSMIREILASVPQMTNCNFAARHKLPTAPQSGHHTHTMSHILDVYVLLYPLYVVAWTRSCPPVAREWSMGQLAHISEHFGIKEASLVLDILRKEAWREDRSYEMAHTDPWSVYKLLGGYAFAAA